MIDELPLLNILDKLIVKLAALVKNQLATNTVEHRLAESHSYEIAGFTYSPDGIIFDRAFAKTENTETWVHAMFELSEQIHHLPEWQATNEFLRQNQDATNAFASLDSFIYKVLPLFYDDNQTETQQAIVGIKKRFLEGLSNQPLEASVVVFLTGLILESETIVLAEGVNLRRTRKEDLEQRRNFDESLTSLLPFPTAILTIDVTLPDRNGAILQPMVEKYVALLRLFATASVQYKYYSISVDIVAPLSSGGNVGRLYPLVHVFKNHLLCAVEEALLIRFVNSFPIPENFYIIERKMDYSKTAYERYSESLLENVVAERKIANAIMGLEAILSNDNKELSFKLQTRISKLLSYTGQDALKTRAVLNKAYSIRSNFAHGGYLSDKEKRSLDANYGSTDAFALKIIDMLRRVLIVTVVIGHDKDKLIHKIDDALIDDKSGSTLQQMVAGRLYFLTPLTI